MTYIILKQRKEKNGKRRKEGTHRGMELHGRDATGRLQDALGDARVLEGEQAQHPSGVGGPADAL